MLMLLPATAAHANYYPRGTPDLTITLSKTYPDTIRLDSRNYTMLLSEMDKLPVLLNSTLLPKTIELLLDNKEKFYGQYVEFASIEYDVNNSTMDVRVSTSSNRADSDLEQTILLKPMNMTAESERQRLYIIERVYVKIPIFWNFTSPHPEEVGNDKEDERSYTAYTSALQRVRAIVPQEVRAVADHAKDVLMTQRDEILGKEGSLEINNIYLKMFDIDMTRVIVFAPDKSGEWIRTVDDVRTGVIPWLYGR